MTQQNLITPNMIFLAEATDKVPCYSYSKKWFCKINISTERQDKFQQIF